MKKFKNRWLVTLCVSILVLGMVGMVNAATINSGQNHQQAIANWMANDTNPMPMNLNANVNTGPANGATSNNGNAQPSAENTQPAANTNGQNSQQPANNGQSAGQTPAPASQSDPYNRMLQACLQMNGQMMNGQMMIMGQQDFAAMQQACQQWYQQGQKNPQNTQSPAQSSRGSMNMSGKWSYMGMTGGNQSR